MYHELGTVYHARYLFDQAESWFRQALYLSDQLGKPRQMAVEFHHLGRLAQNRGLLYEDAENWYLLALEKFEELGDRRSAGDQCRQLGESCSTSSGKLDEAEQWYLRAKESCLTRRAMFSVAPAPTASWPYVAEDRGRPRGGTGVGRPDL